MASGMIAVVGGVYAERCMRPQWYEVYGSGGRAASAIATMGESVQLHTLATTATENILRDRGAIEGFSVFAEKNESDNCIEFDYDHPLAVPTIFGLKCNAKPMDVSAERVVQFGMIETTCTVHASYAVYDPQNAHDPTLFAGTGSSADHLALVLNGREAGVLSALPKAEPAAQAVALCKKTGAEVVVIKMGPRGALVYNADKDAVVVVPAFNTGRVWKIGSGDVFAAHFGYRWMSQELGPVDAARLASKATAYYCATQGFPTPYQLEEFAPPTLNTSLKFQAGSVPTVYLAGPFFSLGQLWLVEQARAALINAGMNVFSPYHDIGAGAAAAVVALDIEGIINCDLLFAIADGMDAGTIYEVGYAKALGKPVIVYCENESEEDRKMMEGSECVMCDDFATSIYKALWQAAQL